MKLTPGNKYTIIRISGMATTSKTEITCLGWNDPSSKVQYTHRGKRKPYQMTLEMAETLVFEGWDIPVVVDMDTNMFNGNACLNFVTDHPASLRNLISLVNINDEFSAHALCLYEPTQGRDSDISGKILYPDVPTPQHAVLQAIRREMEA